MTRKDYVALAEALRLTQPPSASNPNRDKAWSPARQWIMDVRHVANILEAENPRFDRQRFVKACQGERL